MGNWVDVKTELPDIMDKVLALCSGMGEGGRTEIIVAYTNGEDENGNAAWYSGFPYDQPVFPTHWAYSMSGEAIELAIHWDKFNA